MKKYINSLFYIFIPIIGMGQTDSITEKKLSIGIELSPFTYSKWNFPENQSVETVHPGSTRDVSKRYNAFSTMGINLSYRLNRKIILSTGLNYIYENINAVGTTDTFEGYTVDKDIRLYKCKYWQIPAVLNLRISDNSKYKKFTNIKIGLNFDFIYFENSNYAYETISNSAGYGYYHTYLNGNKHGLSNSFNRITPFVYIGREIYTERKIFSFSYGSMFTCKSIYQNHVASEFYKNYKITPIVTGVFYHF